jgi:hypothetical protein
MIYGKDDLVKKIPLNPDLTAHYCLTEMEEEGG